MALFKGEETYSMDSKGRVNVPAKMRKCITPEADGTFVLTRGFEKCIFAYPLDEWRIYEDNLVSKNQFDEKTRYFLRKFLSWTEEVKIDGQNRITLPKKLSDFAGIDGKVKIVGQLDHIEFWNPGKFEEYDSKYDESFEDIAAEVMARQDG